MHTVRVTGLALAFLVSMRAAGADSVPMFGTYLPKSTKVYESHEVQSQYVAMRDGVKLAVDVLLPKGLAAGEKVPAAMYLTSFWRSVEVRWPFNHFHEPDPLQLFFVKHGYAVVLVDVRGTGASFGTRLYPWQKEELEDAGELLKWVLGQPWCDGKVGAFGLGYEATTAELLTVAQNPALKAAIPEYGEFDTYLETAFPGGIFNEWFTHDWSEYNRLMGQSIVPKEVGRVARMFAKGVSPVAGDENRALFKQALQEHKKNLDLYELAKKVACRDTKVTVGSYSGSIDDFTVFRHRAEVGKAGTPMFAWGSWFCGASNDSVIRRFMTYSNPVRGVIGPWNKGADQNASPYAKSPEPTPSLEAQRMDNLRFFDRYLRGLDTGPMPNKILYYYTMGAEQWRETMVWPPAGSAPERWYLAADHALSREAPQQPDAADRYVVDFHATTGTANRWHSHLLGAHVNYGNRAEADTHLLTYTAPPLAQDTEITGHPIVALYVTSTATDGAFYVYLEDVAPDGRVSYLTEGELRALHRKVSTEKPPYTVIGPYHTFLEKDKMPLKPGETAELTFALLPVSVVVPKGHRLRVAIAGHDADTFARIPADRTPTITVAHDKAHASWIDIPTMHGKRS